MRFFKKIILSSLILALIPMCQTAKHSFRDSLGARVFPDSATEGELIRVDLQISKKFLDDHKDVYFEAEFLGKKARLFEQGEDGKWAELSAFFGIPFGTRPAKLLISIETKGLSDQKSRYEAIIDVRASDYPSESLKVAPKHVSPDKRALARIRQEQSELKEIYQSSVPQKLWKGPFLQPVSSVVTSGFGIRRVYNGQMQSYHQGVDFRAPEGTPIFATGGGQVVLAKDLYMTGNTVVLDHGFGVFTVYAHLSALKVRVGERVEAKQLIGLSGMTGRSSGPHLHWGANVMGTRVNPLGLLKVMR